MQTIDLASQALREMNAALQAQSQHTNATQWEILNPRGAHAIAVGLDAPIEVTVRGSTGYYCAGMNKQATVHVAGSAGPGVAENMMSGTVIIDGDASQYAGATGRGGLLGLGPTASRKRCARSIWTSCAISWRVRARMPSQKSFAAMDRRASCIIST